MKRFILFVILIATGKLLYSQHHIGVKMTGGISRFDDIYTYYYLFYDEHTTYAPSGQFGLYYLFNTSGKFFIDMELYLDHLESKISGTDGIDKVEYLDVNNYLTTPINFGCRFGKFGLSGGPQASYKIFSYTQTTTKHPLPDGTVHVTKDQYSPSVLANLLFGLRLDLYFHLTRRFAIEGIFYRGYGSMFKDTPLSTDQLIHQFTLGLRYSFMVKEQKD